MRIVCTILLIIYLTTSGQAVENYKNIWRLSKPDIYPPYLVDCTNCNDEEIGAAFECDPERKKITLELYASALATGEEDAIMPATLRLSFGDYNQPAKLKLYEFHGYTPVLSFEFNDPIFNELKHTRNITINIKGTISEYSAAGLSPLISEFLRRCKSQ